MRRRVLAITTSALLLCILAVIFLWPEEPAYQNPSSSGNTLLAPSATPFHTLAPSAEPSLLPSLTPDVTPTPTPTPTPAPTPKNWNILFRNLTSRYVVLYDLREEEILYSKRLDERCYPASLTKLLTAAVALEHCEMTELFTVGNELNLVAADASVADLKVGMSLSLEVLLDAMMLPSGNDAAYVVAVGVGRKVAEDPTLPILAALTEFLNLMNEKAQECGATNSHFANPDGYPHDDHYTTPADFLKIARYSLNFPEIRQSASKKQARYVVSGQVLEWKSTNYLLQEESPYYCSYATGLKTGYTNAAGGCIAVTGKDENKEILVLLMKAADRPSRYTDAKTVLTAFFD